MNRILNALIKTALNEDKFQAANKLNHLRNFRTPLMFYATRLFNGLHEIQWIIFVFFISVMSISSLVLASYININFHVSISTLTDTERSILWERSTLVSWQKFWVHVKDISLAEPQLRTDWSNKIQLDKQERSLIIFF